MQVNVSPFSAESQDQSSVTPMEHAAEPNHVSLDFASDDSHSTDSQVPLKMSPYDTSVIEPIVTSEGLTRPDKDQELVASLHNQVERQAKYQALIRRLTMAIQNSTELSEILKIAAEGTAQVLNVDQAMVLRIRFWDPRHSIRSSERIPKARVIIDAKWSRFPTEVEENTAPATSSGHNGVVPGQSFWISDCGLCQHAMTGGSQALLFNQAEQFAETLKKPETAPLLSPKSMPSLLMVPLESKNKVLGFLTVQKSQDYEWQIEEVELLELLAAQLSSAVLQTETLRQVESLVEERTAQLQQSLELQAKLYEITRKQIEKLREMNQRMDEFLSTLSHELRTPLTSMMMAIRMLREASLPEEKRSRYLEILEKQCAQETSLVNDLLALQELETKQVAMQVQEVHLPEMFENLRSSFDQRWGMKGLTLDLKIPPELPQLSTDAASVKRILLELITNAGKYADPSTAISINVSQPDHHSVVIQVTNFGVGIEADELPLIFDKFRRCQGMTQQAVPGTGLGLALVKSLLQHLNGDVTATSEPCEGKSDHETRFTVTLPLALDAAKA
ncbi:sensor histidine kinase [Romeriopsis navalis]|nr:HAMP domain-containing sensor histidine kinase [Romeriopsis navalis]